MTSNKRKRRPFNGSRDDHEATQLLAALTTDPADGTTWPAEPDVVHFGGASAGTMPPAEDRREAGPKQPIRMTSPDTELEVNAAGYPTGNVIPRLRAQPRYTPPPPAGYADTTGPMPALGRPAVSIGDALTRDDHWGPKLTPLPCGHCGTTPEIPAGILDRTRIIGHVNWLARQAGWTYDTDIILTCPACQQHDTWKTRQGQVEVRWPDGGYCRRHAANDPGAHCTCPGAVLATDVMLASQDHLGRRGGIR